MPAKKKTALPVLRVARFIAVSEAMEKLVMEKASVFAGNIQQYRTERRENSERKLGPEESASILAAVLATDGALSEAFKADPGAAIASIQNSDLKAIDEPPMQETLLAAGLATTGAFIDAILRLCALVMLPEPEFEAARESDTLDDVITEYVKANLEDLEIGDMKALAGEVIDHVSKSAERPAGEALGLVITMVSQAISQAISTTGLTPDLLASLTGSPPSTDGLAAKSSTD